MVSQEKVSSQDTHNDAGYIVVPTIRHANLVLFPSISAQVCHKDAKITIYKEPGRRGTAIKPSLMFLKPEGGRKRRMKMN
jgi:hypothetical protein